MFGRKRHRELMEYLESMHGALNDIEYRLREQADDREREWTRRSEEDRRRKEGRFTVRRHLEGMREMLADLSVERLVGFLEERRRRMEGGIFTMDMLIVSHCLETARLSDLAEASPGLFDGVAALLARTEVLTPENVEPLARDLQAWLDARHWLDGRGDMLAEVVAASTPTDAWLKTLSSLRDDDPDLDRAILARAGELLSSFDILMEAGDTSVQWVLREIDNRDLVVALSVEPPGVVERILRAYAKRAGEMVREDMEYLGSPDPGELERARRIIGRVVRDLLREGRIYPDQSFEEPPQ